MQIFKEMFLLHIFAYIESKLNKLQSYEIHFDFNTGNC